jgi:hypothetical protein
VNKTPAEIASLVREITKANIKQRFGAAGKCGTIAVTERVIKTLKYEWQRCVPIIKGFDHLTSQCMEFEHLEAAYDSGGPPA